MKNPFPPIKNLTKKKLPSHVGPPGAIMNYHLLVSRNTSVKKRRDMNIGDIWLNQVTCLSCMDTITSHNRHDFKYCSCRRVAVDGGSWYAKRLISKDGKYESNVVPFRYLPKSE